MDVGFDFALGVAVADIDRGRSWVRLERGVFRSWGGVAIGCPGGLSFSRSDVYMHEDGPEMTEPQSLPEEITFTGGPLDGITVRRDGNTIVVEIGAQHVRYGPDGEYVGEVG